MSDQPDAGATSETAQIWKTIHIKHTLSHPNKANMEWWLRRPNDIRRSWEGLKFPDICLTGKEKPRKNLTQETCPDRGSNPGPLRDKRACYHLLHSGGRQFIWILIFSSVFFEGPQGQISKTTGGPQAIIWETLLILQPFRHFIYVTIHSPTLPSLYLRQSAFFNSSVASPTSQSMTHGNHLSLFSQYFMKFIALPDLPTSHSTLSNKRGI